MSTTHYLGNMMKKQYHSYSHTCWGCWALVWAHSITASLMIKIPSTFCPQPLTPFQRAWKVFGTPPLSFTLKIYSPASNTETLNIPSQCSVSSSESHFQSHCQFRSFCICITKKCIWLVFLGKWNNLLKWTIEASSSCQTEMACLELSNDRFHPFCFFLTSLFQKQ